MGSGYGAGLRRGTIPAAIPRDHRRQGKSGFRRRMSSQKKCGGMSACTESTWPCQETGR